MSEWKQKRFWKKAETVPVTGGFTVHLDGRAIKTPVKAALIVPTRAIADAISAEWDAQQDLVKPQTMPVTRAANAAIDKVTPQFGEVADMLAAYGDSDLLCYRATTPDALTERQSALWDPLLNWAETALNAKLVTVAGVMHQAQSPTSLKELRQRTYALNAFELAAFHDLVSLSGSLIIAFAAIKGHLPPQTLWELSRLDEIWQQEQWGKDDEAQAAAAIKAEAFFAAKRFFDLCQSPSGTSHPAA
jgi:chaperone required for assembly of F1-ATPase